MNSCRVARRVASMNRRQNACARTGKRERLATKDMHYAVQSFSVSQEAGRLAVVVVERRLVGRSLVCESSAAGVRFLSPCRGARRVAWRAAPGVPLCIPPSLVTKQRKGSDAA
jgi:hypothetical protein